MGLYNDKVMDNFLNPKNVGEIEDPSDSDLTVGQKVAALMGGMGRSFNGSYAEYAAWKQRQASYQAADRSADGSAPRKKQERPRTGSPEKQLQRVEKEISRLEEQLQLLEEESAKYGSDYQKLMELDAQKEALNDMLMEQYERWEALSNG